MVTREKFQNQLMYFNLQYLFFLFLNNIDISAIFVKQKIIKIAAIQQ